jgi:membrane protease subunit (stomatin/prohibitin family)
MNEQLSSKWRDLRGIEIVSCGVNSIVADEKDEDMLKSLQRAAALKDPELGKGYLAGQFGQAAVDAANNEKGSDVLGVGIVSNVAAGVAGVYGQSSGDDTAAFKAKVEKLAMMKDAGLLTDEEFAAMKKELLASI